ncbi:MAG: hypothetical protein MEQ07_10235 [Aquimonas sp.]|nr:hypothetical protein [Aquimonas sp.]
MAGNWSTLHGRAPEVIAHRGASGLRPEHSLDAYALGLAQGADVIEPDLVPCADGQLLCRHEPALAATTDIARRPQFAGRRRDGDWYSTDFRLDELSALRLRQAFPGRSREFDGRCPPLAWRALLAWAGEQAQARGRLLVLFPELKHPAAFTAQGLDPVPAFLASLDALPQGVEVRVQCFEPEPLRRVHAACGLPCTWLLEAQADWASAIAQGRGWLAGLGPDKTLLFRQGVSSGLVEAAHAAALRVDAWTFRNDRVGAGWSGIEAELGAVMALGVDGLFCDFPATAVEVRARGGGLFPTASS